MSNFSTKIFGLAGAAAVFAGMAFGQTTCTNAASSATFVPVEATTAQVAPLTFTCGSAVTPAGTINVTVYTSLPITSKVTASGTSTTEAVISNGVTQVQGVLTNPTTLNFTNVALTAGANNFTVSNIRVNATSLTVGVGVPPAITENAFISGPGAVNGLVSNSVINVGFATNGLSSRVFKSTFAPVNGAITNGSSGAINFVVCTGQSFALSTVVQINEGFTAAFRAASEGPQVAIGTSNAANTNDRLQIVFTNVPANATLYLPSSPIMSQTGGAMIQLTTSATGAFTALTASTSTAAPVVYGGGVAAIGGTGTATAYFDVRTEDLAFLDQFNVPVYVSYSANAVAGSAAAISESVSYAPVGSTQIPNFVIGASTTTLTGTAFQLCTTSLLFPFVTNQLGFDTGLAISNTSTDPFGGRGAVAQAGTCSLNFYGAGAPTPSTVTSPNVPSGTTFTQVLSGVAPGFQGYMIAQCAFQYAHGFAFITNGVGVNGGLSQGYLAGIIPDVNQVVRGANPLSFAGPGTGETLGN
jgi:hypothetical protein